jgi:hypothetical protein
VCLNVNVNELRLGFSNTTRNPEGILSHNNRKRASACVWRGGGVLGTRHHPSQGVSYGGTPGRGATCPTPSVVPRRQIKAIVHRGVRRSAVFGQLSATQWQYHCPPPSRNPNPTSEYTAYPIQDEGDLPKVVRGVQAGAHLRLCSLLGSLQLALRAAHAKRSRDGGQAGGVRGEVLVYWCRKVGVMMVSQSGSHYGVASWSHQNQAPRDGQIRSPNGLLGQRKSLLSGASW